MGMHVQQYKSVTQRSLIAINRILSVTDIILYIILFVGASYANELVLIRTIKINIYSLLFST